MAVAGFIQCSQVYVYIHMYLYVCVYTLTKRGSVLPSVKLTNWPEPMQLQRHTIVKPPICSTAICVRANKCKLNQHTHTSEFMLAARSGQLLLDLGFYCLTAVWPRIEVCMYNCTYVCMYNICIYIGVSAADIYILCGCVYVCVRVRIIAYHCYNIELWCCMPLTTVTTVSTILFTTVTVHIYVDMCVYNMFDVAVCFRECPTCAAMIATSNKINMQMYS